MKKAIAKNNGQQGDVLLKRLDTLPDGECKVISHGKMVLAEGEVTGHYHGIEEVYSSLYQYGNVMVMDLKASAILTHQEHGHIQVEAGIWEVRRVQEYDYFSKMKRQVVD